MTTDLTSANELDLAQVPRSGGFESIYARIRARAAADPDGIATADTDSALTFAELEENSGRLAARVRAAGVVSGACVGLFLDRSPEFVAAASAILRAGAAYLPLDVASPRDRIEYVLSDAAASMVVTSARQVPQLPPGPWRTLIIDEPVAGDADDPPPAPYVEPAPDDLAYIIYTSGSTGRPKGVELTHANLANLVDWHVSAFGVGPGDRASQVASVGFDAAVWEIWPHLAAGAAVHFADDRTRRSPQLLRDWLVAQKITISFVPTVLAEQLIHLTWPDRTALRTLLTGADVLHRRPPSDLPFCLVNNYGPTECTVVATSGTVVPDANGHSAPGHSAPSIGRPVTNATALILDDQLRPVPPGQPGELCLAGTLVGRGYRNDPELTATRFVTLPADSVHKHSGAPLRVYRTGDQVRLLENGEIAYLGRLDSQVKIRGFRIEPAEIVASLNRFPGVAASTVVARVTPDVGTGGAAAPPEPELVAYVVPTEGAALTAPDLRTFLASRLPDYMIPARIVAIAALPMTINGKLDKTALPTPGRDNLLAGEPDTAGVADGSIGEQIAQIVQALLERPSVNPREDIFLLGGHSMLAMQLVSRIRQVFGVKLTLRQVFGEPTIEGLTAEVARRTSANGTEARVR
jgi:amino acid adenylation domain-containing protein